MADGADSLAQWGKMQNQLDQTKVAAALENPASEVIVVSPDDFRVRWISPSLRDRLTPSDDPCGWPLGDLCAATVDLESLLPAAEDRPVVLDFAVGDILTSRTMTAKPSAIDGTEYLLLEISSESTMNDDAQEIEFELTPEIVEVAPVPTLVWDVETHEIYDMNHRLEELYGQSRSEVIGTRTDDHAASADVLRERVSRRLQDDAHSYDEMLVYDSNGELRVLVSSSSLVKYKGRRCFFTGFSDVTERRRMERELRQSEERYSILVNSVPEAILVHNGVRIVWANQQAVTLYRADSLEQVMQTPLLEFMHPDSRKVAAERVGKVLAGGESLAPMHERVIRMDGTIIEAEISSASTVYDGKPAALVVVRDITEQITSRAALQESEAKYRTLVEGVNDTIFQLDTNGKIRFFSGSNHDEHDFVPDNVVGRNFSDYIHPDDLEALQRSFGKTKQGDLEPSEFRIKDKHGNWRHVRTSSRPYFDSDGKPLGLIGVLVDLTERIKSETALRESESRLRVAQDLTGVYTIAFDIESQSWTIPDDIAARLGIWEVDRDKRPAKMRRLIAKKDRGRIEEVLESTIAEKSSFDTEFSFVLDNGEEVQFRVVAQYDGGARLGSEQVFAALQEITEIKKQEAERMQMLERSHQNQKLDSLGILAGGVAHDFNNLLTGILGYTELLQSVEAPGSKGQRYATEIENISRRAAELTQQLLAYAGRGKMFVVQQDLSSIIADFLPLAKASIPKSIDLISELEPAMPAHEVDPSQIQHLMMNLLMNAVEAIGDDHGRINVRTRLETITERLPETDRRILPLAPGDYAVFEVEDTGHGVDGTSIRQLFEPFFTTKFVGRGLGLSAAHGIVQSHGGTIEFLSTDSGGTLVRALIPATTVAPDENGHVTIENDPSAKCVLVVDDDQDIRELVEEILLTAGYRVVLAAGGADCGHCLEQYQIDAVFLDIAMPRMGGDDVYRQIREHYPGLPVVLSSGSSQDHLIETIAKDPVARFLQKPFNSDTLLREFRDCMRASSTLYV